MDSRIALQPNTRLHYSDSICFTLLSEIGRGASSIVYDATYAASNKEKDVKHVRIKECYPFKLHIRRMETGELRVASTDEAAFREKCQAFENAFHLGNRLINAAGLKASLNSTLDTFHCNGTIYLVSADLADQTLATFPLEDIRTCVALAKQVAFILEKIHEAGYLYLDIKPENILIAQRETPQAFLFDFDSMIPLNVVKDRSCSLEQIRMSYSKGYAPIEQQTAKLHQMGAYSDVFGLGALLYALLFGRPPCVADCERNAVYAFDSMKYSKRDYQDRLFPAITAFFHKAIAVCRLDRYQTMSEAYTALETIERLADKAAPFIRSTHLPASVECIGRQAELAQLTNWLKQPDSSCIFVTGMGGIGKSTLVQTFLKENRKQIDQVLYLLFNESLEQTLTDDTSAAINHVARDPKESLEEYYERKQSIFRELVADTTTVLVLDNYVYDTEQSIQALLNVGWKVIFISREAAPFKAYQKTAVMLDRLNDRTDLFHLFESNLGSTISELDIPFVDRIIQRVNGHTLVLELIAKQIRSSHITISATAELVEQHGFANIGPEKVSYEKDQKKDAQTIRDILTGLFQDSFLSSAKQGILKTMSLVNEHGIDIHLLQRALALKSSDDVNELVHDGWLRCDMDHLTMHPVICETVRGWRWDETSRKSAGKMMACLFKDIRLEVGKEEYPQGMLKSTQLFEKIFQKRPWLRKSFEQKTARKGVVGEIYYQRFCKCNEVQITDPRIAAQLIGLSEGILSNAKLEPDLIEGSSLQQSYLDLLYQTVLHVPCHEEAFILDGADELLRLSRYAQRQKMEVCKRATQIYLDRHDFPNAWAQVQKAKRINRLALSCHVHAQYHDIMTDYYDSKLGGAYDLGRAADTKYRLKLMKSIEKMIIYAKLAHQADSKQLLAAGLLGKATVLIRARSPEHSGGRKQKQIEHLLKRAGEIVSSEAQRFSKLYHQYDMVLAWYYSLIEDSLEKASDSMLDARVIALRIFPTQIDLIDCSLMPCANIYCEMGDYKEAESLLMLSIKLCEQQTDVLPYIRKKMELYRCLLDVYREWGKSEEYNSLIAKTDAENEKNRSSGIFKEVSDEDSAHF